MIILYVLMMISVGFVHELAVLGSGLGSPKRRQQCCSVSMKSPTAERVGRIAAGVCISAVLGLVGDLASASRFSPHV